MAITRHVKRAGKLWIRISPTIRSPGSRSKSAWWRQGRSGRVAAVVEPGRVMYEISGVTEDVAREAFRLATHKLPVATRVLIRGAW